jgi:Protein of unknown function (DUF3667)
MSSCRNCGADAPDRYCPRCGQETTQHLPSAREFVHEFILHYFAAEGRLWRTLKVLVLQPGRLTVEYISGRKLAYVLPLRLYLTVSVVFFLLLQLTAAPAATERLAAKFHRALNDGQTTISVVDLGFARAVRNPDGSFSCNLPGWLCNRIKARVQQSNEDLERRLASLPAELLGHFSTAMFVLLPLFALYLQLAYFRRTYGEHFLFALHVHSFWFLVLLVLLLPLPIWIQAPLQVYLFVYTVIALRAVYAAAWWKTILKGLAIGLAYVVSLLIATVLIGVWAFIR